MIDMEANEVQTSVPILFGVTLVTSLIPSLVKHIRSLRRDNNQFNVSDSSGTKTCLRHQRQCSSYGSTLLQVLNFFIGGLLLGLLVMRLMPTTYREFDSIYKTNMSSAAHTEPSVVTEDNVIVLNDNTNKHQISVQSSDSKKSLPYVEMMFAGFFFLVYFIDQILQAISGWQGWHSKSSFVHLPAISPSKQATDKSKAETRSDRSSAKECSEPSLVACYRKNVDEITELNGETSAETGDRHQHKPDCPMAKSEHNDESTLNRKLRIPCRPSHPTSIIIVLPKEANELSTTWLKLKAGLAVIASVATHQLTNGVTIALQEGYWCWCALAVVLFHSLLTAILMTSKLMKHSSDHSIMFLCQLIFASLSPLGIITSSFAKTSSFSQLLLMGLSSGATLHLVFMELLQSQQCSKLAGLFQYMAMYTGFTIVLCIGLLIGYN